MSPSSRSDASLDRHVGAGAAGGILRRGVAWTLGGQWVGYAVQVGTIAVLARLLTPDDFGLIAMVLAVTALLDQFRSLGLSQAVVQREKLSWAQMDSLFWINGLVGVVLAGLLAAGGPLLAAFYGRDELVMVSLALAGGYLLSGFAIQHQALLSRQMRFAVLARRSVSARLAASIVAVVAALLGAGYWSLVLQQIASVLLSAIVVWTAVRWVPGRPRELRSTLPLVRFGAGVSAAALMNTLARQADNIIIGRVLGAGPLGIYSRAYALLMLPLRQMKDPIGVVVVPVLSALTPEPARYRRVYRAALAGVCHIGLPGMALLAVVAGPLIDVLLGDQWTAAVPVFQVLALAGICQVVSATTGWLFVSSGRTGAYAAWAAVSSVLTVASFVVGVRWGLQGVAWAYAIGQVVLALPAFVVACRGTPVRLADVLDSMWRPVLVGAVVASAALLVQWQWASQLAAGLDLAVSLLAAALVWGVVVAVWPRARAEVLALVRLRKDRRVPGGAA